MKKNYCNGMLCRHMFKTFLIMKFLVICLLLSILQVQAKVYAQTGKLSLNLPDVSVEEIFSQIEEKSGLAILYNNNQLELTRKVNVVVENATVSQVLDKIFEGTPNSYLINDRHIIVTLKSSVGNYGVLSAQQEKEIRGTVTDADGQPLPGVSIVIKGTTKGTITDFDGKFQLENVPDDATLIFSFVGMTSQEIAIKGQSIINVVLLEETLGLDEVVAVGYGTQKKVNLTGAVATIDNEELMKVPVASTTQSLAGKLPGLVVKQSEGKPGSTPSISIRGFGQPLVIVDGIEQQNFENIDANEIESYSVLKDASAAIYGSRAGNGVILITTKRGKTSKPVFSFNNSVSMQSPTVYPKFVDSWDYAIIQNEAREFAGQSPMFTEAEIQKFRDGTDPDYPNVNHYDEVIKKGSLMASSNLSVSGGSEKVDYFFSLGYLYQDGIYKSNGVDLNRYNVRSNVDIKLTDNLSVGLDLSSRRTVNHDVPFSSQQIFQTIGTTTNRYPASYPDPNKMTYVGRSSHNTLIKINPDLAGYNNTNRQYLVGALTLKYDIPFVKGLNLKVKGNYVSDESYNKKWTQPYATNYYDRTNDTYSVAATGGKYSLTERTDRFQELTFQGFLEYEMVFTDHEIKALFVSEVIDSKSNWFNAYKDGFISNAVDQMFAGSNENMSTDGSAFEESRVSYVGRLNYAYKSKYLFEGTLRNDGSSRFSEDYRWGLFPSLSFGWRISEENLIQEKVPFIDNLKLRLSYSHTGFDRNANPYQYLSTYAFRTQYVFGSTPYKTLRNNGISNQLISWEDIHTYNSGLDVDMWNGLLGAEFDAFYRLRKGILGSRTSTLPNTFGATLPQENINSISDRGFELVLKHRNKIREFNYSVNANISWTRSKFEDYAEQEYNDPDEKRLYKRVGNWTNRIFGYKTDGFLTQADLDNSTIDYDRKGNATLKPGMIKYVDVNNDKEINWRDQVEIGKGSTPNIMFGLNFNCDYKGFDFNMLWQGAADYSIEFSQNMRTLTINHVWNSYKFLYEGRWTPDNPNASFPRTTNGHHSYHNRRSDLWLKPGDYIRLKNISLGYSLPESLISRINFDKVRFYVAGYNVLTFDRLGDFSFDPEGIGHSWTYPLYKSFSFGVNITL